MAEDEIKRGRHKPTKLERQQRLKQIHKMIILGLTLEEMAQRIGCNERTVRRDLDADYERLERDGQREVAANRAAIMAELGRTYAEAVKDYETAKLNDRDTFGYLNSRVRALGLMARISGAEVPSRLIVQGQIGVKHTVEPAVQMVSQAELLKMAAIAAEVAGQAPGFRPNGHGNGQHSGGNGQN
jgi:transcriptional regulator with XRE-family HTH domain